MTEAFEFRSLLPAVPEIVLVLGAMALLMIGAFRGDRSAVAVNMPVRNSTVSHTPRFHHSVSKLVCM